VRQYIGITMVSLNPDIAAELKMINTNFPDVEQGVLVYRVVTGSPACRSVFPRIISAVVEAIARHLDFIAVFTDTCSLFRLLPYVQL